MPGAYRYAHAQHKGVGHSTKWAKEEFEEIGYPTSGLDAFVKGLSYDDLPSSTLKKSILDILWVYDAKLKPHAKLVANGSQECVIEEKGTFSSALKLENVKIILVVIAQKQMEFKFIDVKKAFFKGDCTNRSTYGHRTDMPLLKGRCGRSYCIILGLQLAAGSLINVSVSS